MGASSVQQRKNLFIKYQVCCAIGAAKVFFKNTFVVKRRVVECTAIVWISLLKNINLETLKCEENPETCESPVEIANAGQSVQFSSPILLQVGQSLI